MKPLYGYILLGLAFLGGAYVTVLSVDQVNWTHYLGFLALGALGLWIAKKSGRRDASASHVLKADKEALFASIDRIIANLEELKDTHKDTPVYELRHLIDRKFRDDLNRFVEARKSMVYLYSTQAYADVMSAFAAGERYLNRVWSASADGYVDEVNSYLAKAYEQFVETRKKLQEVDAAHAPQGN